MPLYMDLHIVPGVKANDVAEAHRLDVLIQDDHSCKCMTYWVDESRGHVFCLIDAPGKETVIAMHNKAHGLVPHKIIEVQTSLVESFLGRITDPADAALNADGLKLLTDPSFRILLQVQLPDPILLSINHGKDKAAEMTGRQWQSVQHQVLQHGGVEAEHEGSAIIASFTSATGAVKAATAIQQLAGAGVKIGVSAGEPVTNNNKLFGDTIQLAERIAFIAKDRQVGLSAQVRELLSKSYFEKDDPGIFALSQQEEDFLNLVFDSLKSNWEDTEFNLDDYSHKMAMSKSQLYRKTVALTGFSPGHLLSEYRLHNAKDMLRKQYVNISQVSFSTGFSSPSYFTKCFKKKFGILPLAYQEMLQQ